jgi:hypothetical protein
VTSVELERAVAAEERLADALKEHAGRWVAVRGHEIVAVADTIEGLLDEIDPSAVDRVFQVAEADTVAFY